MDQPLPPYIDELRKQLQDLSQSVQQLRTQVSQLDEHRPESGCRQREERNCYHLSVNTTRKSLDELLGKHTATEKERAQHADVIDGERRVETGRQRGVS